MWIAIVILLIVVALETKLVFQQYEKINEMEIMLTRQQCRIRVQRERISFYEGDKTKLTGWNRQEERQQV